MSSSTLEKIIVWEKLYNKDPTPGRAQKLKEYREQFEREKEAKKDKIAVKKAAKPPKGPPAPPPTGDHKIGKQIKAEKAKATAEAVRRKADEALTKAQNSKREFVKLNADTRTTPYDLGIAMRKAQTDKATLTKLDDEADKAEKLADKREDELAKELTRLANARAKETESEAVEKGPEAEPIFDIVIERKVSAAPSSSGEEEDEEGDDDRHPMEVGLEQVIAARGRENADSDEDEWQKDWASGEEE